MAGPTTLSLTKEGLEAALKAVRLDERNPYTHYALAIVSVYSERLEQAISAARKAIEISPSFALGHCVLGMATSFQRSCSGGNCAARIWATAEPIRSTELCVVQHTCTRAPFLWTCGSRA